MIARGEVSCPSCGQLYRVVADGMRAGDVEELTTTTVQELAETLEAMRAEGPIDVMTRLFGILFCADIEASGRSPAEIKKSGDGQDIAHTIRDGMTLASYVTVNEAHVRKWRQQ